MDTEDLNYQGLTEFLESNRIIKMECGNLI